MLHKSISRYGELVSFGHFPLGGPKYVIGVKKVCELEGMAISDKAMRFFKRLLIKYVELYCFVPPKDSSLRALNRDETEETKVNRDKIVAKYNRELGHAVFFIEEFHPKYYDTMVKILENAEKEHPWLRNSSLSSTALAEGKKYGQPSPEAQKTLDEFFESEEFSTVEGSVNGFYIGEKNSATEELKIKFPGGDP